MVTPVSTPETLTEQDTHIEFSDVTVRYDNEIALDSISLKIPRNQIFGIIGPANSGKTTLLTCINRTLELEPTASLAGTVTVSYTHLRAHET